MISRIISIIIITLLIFFFVILPIGTYVQEISGMNHYWTEKGDCFDRGNNKINGVTCDVRRYCSENPISILRKCQGGEDLK